MLRSVPETLHRYASHDNRMDLYSTAFLVPLHHMVAQAGNEDSIKGHLDNLQRQKGRATKLGARAAHLYATRHPDTAKYLLDRPWQAVGMEVVGRGWHSTVVRDGASVVKYYHLLDSDPAQTARTMQQGADLTHAYLPLFAVHQSFDVVQNPIGDGTVVAAHQSYIDPFDAKNYSELNPDVPEIEHLVAGANNMREATGYVPDLNGAGNVGYDSAGRLRMVDTVPLSIVKATATIKILESLSQPS